MAGFRSVCRWLHRELGFVTVGLTLVYGISGIAVNHAHQWDANHIRTTQTISMEPVGRGPTAELVPVVLDRLHLTEPVKSTWRASAEMLQVFLEGTTYSVNLDTGAVLREAVARRPFFFELNFMHLNMGKGPWTWIADVYAAVLMVLAISGIFLVKGRRGLAGRGGVLLVAGILLPVIYLWIERAAR
jgi:hypothetical protein